MFAVTIIKADIKKCCELKEVFPWQVVCAGSKFVPPFVYIDSSVDSSI